MATLPPPSLAEWAADLASQSRFAIGAVSMSATRFYLTELHARIFKRNMTNHVIDGGNEVDDQTEFIRLFGVKVEMSGVQARCWSASCEVGGVAKAAAGDTAERAVWELARLCGVKWGWNARVENADRGNRDPLRVDRDSGV